MLLFYHLVAPALLAVATPSPPAVQAARLAEPAQLQMDGRLDEPFWQEIEPIADFVQQEPREGAAPTERTEVRIAFDEDHLYIGATLYDSEPSGILAHQRERDAGLGTDDRFMWILDTFRDGRTGYFFEINPAGLMGDGLLRGAGGVNKAWNGIWLTRVSRSERGWSAEIRIPFRTLNFDPASDTWGINFQRTIRRKNEEVLWSGHRRNEGLFNPAHAGRVTGLRDLSQGLGLELKPYVSASAREASGPLGPETETPADLGFDLTYSLTPGLRASLSVNTDFAEAEVDERRVNLTRFPLRFPEKRDFFLEGSSVFSFAPSNGVEPYFSRRVGLVQGQEVPVRYGARIAGQAGAYDVGLLQVRTGGHEAHPAEQFTVARVVRNLFAQSSAGLIYTRRAAVEGSPLGGAADHHTVGTDLELSTSRFLGDRNLRFQAFYVLHTDPLTGSASLSGEHSARGVRLTYPNDLWSGHVSYRELGERFAPAVGFTPRRGFRRLQPTIEFSPRPEWLPSVRRLEFGLTGEYLTDMDGRLETGNLGIGALGVQFESGDYVGLDYDTSFERLDEPFRLHPDTAMAAVVSPGDYTFGGWAVNARTAGRRAVSGRVNLGRASFWSGQRTQAGGEITLRPLPGLNVYSGIERNEVQLARGSFTTNLLRVGSGWHLSPWTSVVGNVQYDDISRRVGLYGRLRWILRPGSDFFLVYTHNWHDALDGLQTLQRGATSKFTYTHRF